MSARATLDPDSWGARLDALVRQRAADLAAADGSSDSRPMTNDELAAELKRLSPGLKVSGAYLSALRTGRRSRPSTELQLAIARYFDVPTSYFLDGAVPVEYDDVGVRSIALRAVGLNDVSRSTILAVLDHVRELQGLPPVVESSQQAAGED